MKALIWKEIRELLPGFWLLLGASWAVGVVDMIYNWNEDRGAGMSLLVVALVSLVGALLAGANSYARESREQIVFLGKWPISRWRIWLAKAIVPAVMWAVLVALATGGCVGMLALRGHAMSPVEALNFRTDGWIFAAMWVMLYGMGLLASVALPSAIGATLTAVIAVGGIVWAYLWAWDFVPAYLGPRLGLLLPEADRVSHLIPALIVAAIALVASAIVATRLLYRAPWRRGAAALGTLAGGIALVLLVALGGWVYVQGRFSDADDISMDNTGRYAMIYAGAESGLQALWSLDVESGRMVRVARGLRGTMETADDAPRVAMRWESAEWNRDFVWVGDLVTGRLWSTDAESWAADLSPDGKWIAAWDEGLVIYPAAAQGERRRRLAVEEVQTFPIIAWAADERSVYVLILSTDGSPGRLLHVEAFTDAPPREVVQIPPGWTGRGIPATGPWAELDRPVEWGSGIEHALLDMRTGELMPLGEWRLFSRAWTADGQHAWVRREVGQRQYEAGLLDLGSGKVARTLGPEDFGGAIIGTTNASRHSPDTLIFTLKPGTDRMNPVREWWWLADPEAAGPKRLAITDDDGVGGWNSQGEIIILRGRTVEALDPDTGYRRLIRELPGTEAGPGE